MEKIPKPVSVLGLGRMGSALAGVLLGAGHEVTVWNRSPGKAAALAGRGAKVADRVADVTGLVLACLSTYDDQQEVLDRLRPGTVLVNLTSGTPEQARAAAKWAASRDIAYIDGVIMAVPQGIGGPSANILYGGTEEVLAEHRALLETLGAVTYLGEDAGLPALYDLALLGIMWSTMSGYLHALALVGTEGVTAERFTPLALGWLDAVKGFLPRMGEETATGAYETEVSALDINASGLALLVEASRAQGISTAVPEPIRELFDRAVAQGHGAHGISSVFEVIKQS